MCTRVAELLRVSAEVLGNMLLMGFAVTTDCFKFGVTRSSMGCRDTEFESRRSVVNCLLRGLQGIRSERWGV